MKKTEKTFDCMAFKRAAQLSVYDEIKEMTHEEELTYFRSKAQNGPLGEWWNRRKGHDAHIPYCAEKGEEYQDIVA
jgi:hypothetical protein